MGEEGQVRSSLKKKRAPQPPVRASSISSPVAGEEGELEQKQPADTTEPKEKGLEESIKTETSPSASRDNEDEDNVDDVDSKISKHPQPELILDVQKLQNNEDLADNEDTLKRKSSEDVDDITEPELDSVEEKVSTGKKLSIVGLAGFIEGLSS